jgi:phosphoribosylaminoimidazolecarboxamide formyltransferase / IMP cyclohydrolase
VKVKRALISVHDKSGLVDFARELVAMGVEIVSTGGTARAIAEAGIAVTEVSDVTKFPEMLDGRVKTMHPLIQGGILARRDVPEHMDAIAQHGIEPIDLVVVSLYPFERVASRRGVDEQTVIENIDIGGPTMIRAAAKNHGDEEHGGVAVVTDPNDYPDILAEMSGNDGEIGFAVRRKLAIKAFQTTAHYDTVIANWFGESQGESEFPDHLLRDFEKVMDLSYGENPHQRAAYYAETGSRRHLLSRVTQMHGKQLSFNNLYDLHAARALADEFKLPCCVIIKHNNPCGCALADSLEHAYQKAFESDPVSAFGSVIAVNKHVDAKTARLMSELFIEVLFAPGFDDEALEILAAKKDIRILVDSERRRFSPGEFDYKRVLGGLLVQDKDDDLEERDGMEVVSERHPTHAEWDDMLFAQRVTKHVKSNSIVIAKNLTTLGVGAGQMSRVDSTRIAIEKALSRGDFEGASIGSDAFYPFPDAVEIAIENGVTAFMHPGGSKGDDDAVRACDDKGAAMVLTHRRHFLH